MASHDGDYFGLLACRIAAGRATEDGVPGLCRWKRAVGSLGTVRRGLCARFTGRDSVRDEHPRFFEKQSSDCRESTPCALIQLIGAPIFLNLGLDFEQFGLGSMARNARNRLSRMVDRVAACPSADDRFLVLHPQQYSLDCLGMASPCLCADHASNMPVRFESAWLPEKLQRASESTTLKGDGHTTFNSGGQVNQAEAALL